MSTIGSHRTSFGDESGTDGRVLTDTDLNAISKNMTRRAWEIPGYAGLVGFDELSITVVRSYADAFDIGAVPMFARIRGVYTFGRGLQVSMSGLGTSVASGMLGCYMDGATPSRPDASGDYKMHWVEVASGDIAYTHDVAASGKTRWDIITVALADVNASTVTRHFKDAVTGQVSSQSVIPARATALTATLTKGEESSGNPTMPSVPAGGHVVYAAKVSDTAVTDAWDFTLPVGVLKNSMTFGRDGVSLASDWDFGALDFECSSKSGIGGTVHLFPPEGLRGDPAGRIIGLQVTYTLFTGFRVYLSKVEIESDVASSDMCEITSLFTIDEALHSSVIDLRSLPFLADTMAPIWANGLNRKGMSTSTVALKVTSPVTTDVGSIKSVRWFSL